MRRLILAGMTAAALLGSLLAMPADATALGGEGKIAFVRANQIYTMTKTGGTVKALTTSATGKNYRPHWSPDGKKIAYINETTAGRKDIWEMSATGTSKVRVTTSGTVTTAPVWAPDGTTLAFAQTATVTVTQYCQGFPSWPDCQPPTTSTKDFVFLVRATAPFGTPNYLKVYPDFLGSQGAYTGAEALPAYPGGTLAWSPNGANLVVINGNAWEGGGIVMEEIDGMFGASAANASLTAREGSLIAITDGSCCGSEDWSDLNYIPNGTLGYATVDHGVDESFDPNPHILVVYPGFVSQQGDKAGAPSPSGAHMVFVRNTSTTNTTPNIWTATIKGAQRKMIVANGYQPDWQPLP